MLSEVESLLSRRELMPTPTAGRSPATAPSTAVDGRRSTVLDPGSLLVPGLASDAAHREARNGHCLASEGVEGVLALEVACASE